MGLLTLIERWLESARLPCAKVVCGGRSYLIRTSPDISRPSTVTDITGTPMPASGESDGGGEMRAGRGRPTVPADCGHGRGCP